MSLNSKDHFVAQGDDLQVSDNMITVFGRTMERESLSWIEVLSRHAKTPYGGNSNESIYQDMGLYFIC